MIDTPPLESGRCSGERADEMTSSIAAASGLKGLPGPTGRGVHRRASSRFKPTGTRRKRTAPRSKARSYVSQRERLTVERPNSDGGGTVHRVHQAVEHIRSLSVGLEAMHPPLESRGFLALSL